MELKANKIEIEIRRKGSFDYRVVLILHTDIAKIEAIIKHCELIHDANAYVESIIDDLHMKYKE